jgi:hypothetical protein
MPKLESTATVAGGQRSRRKVCHPAAVRIRREPGRRESNSVERAGLITARQRKRLYKGDHA